MLRSVFAWSPDERQLERNNLTVAAWLIEGSADAAVALLAQIALDTLSTRLDLVKMTRDPVMVVGDTGIGKSAVVASVVEALRNDGWPVLALRLDRASDSFELGAPARRAPGLPVSPVLALGSVASGAPALLVCDQLDATSRASGRITEVFDAFDELLREAERFPQMRVLACRQFDIDNDQRLRSLVDPSLREPASVVKIPPLDAEAVATAVRRVFHDSATLRDPASLSIRRPLILLGRLPTLDPESLAGLAALD